MTDEPTKVHDPVMVHEVIGFLGGRGTVIDMTVGAGGHAEALLDAGVGRLVGVDRDPTALSIAGERLGRFGDRFVAIRIFFSATSDNRFPSHLSMPRLLRSAPQRIKDEWVRS